MSAVVIEGALPHPFPTHADGTPYAFSMATGKATVFADTRTDLVAYLVDGYSDLEDSSEGDGQALVLRHRAVIEAAEIHQQMVAAEAVLAGTFDPLAADEYTLDAVLGARSEVIITEPWDLSFPLVLVATDYAPYSSEPRPTGNVLWMDPYTETTFLDTLEGAGVLALFTSTR